MRKRDRNAGIILHPASLPSGDGIGDFGINCFDFIDFLSAAGMGIWQILPLGPTGYGDSPYTALSSFAGNPLFISLEVLAQDGLIEKVDLKKRPVFSPDTIDYPEVYLWKVPLLRQAAQAFLQGLDSENKDLYREFCRRERVWLDDFAFFVTAKEHFDTKAAEEKAENSMWNHFWPEKLSLRDPAEIDRYRGIWEREIEVQKVIQYFFSNQWNRIREYAHEKNIRIFGDIPIFVSPNSSDVWAHPDLFKLDEKNRMEKVAGVPPDYFSETGQRWGNPLYRWEEHKKTDYSWWVSRIRRAFDFADMVRIDHFRGFEACWEIPANEPTAIHGSWVKSPGEELFQVFRREIGRLPIVAEDLGVITPEVERLRRKLKFQGMKVLQFAFESDGYGGLNPDNPFLPHNYEPDTVVYTGTHDNDTSLGWYTGLSDEFRNLVKAYLGSTGDSPVRDMIRTVFMSVARTAVIPMQDVLNLGSDARMNTPGTVGNNWKWRVRREAFNTDVSGKLRWLARLYNRL